MSVKAESPKGPPAQTDFWLCTQFCVIGLVSLLGWNFVLGELGTLIGAFGSAYGTWVSMCYSMFINVGQLLLVYVGNKFRFAPRFNIGCTVMAVTLIGLALSAAFLGSNEEKTLGFTLGCVFIGIFGFANALMESSMFGLAAMCPPECVTWIMIGEGLAGFCTWPLNMLCQFILEAAGLDGDGMAYTKLVLFFGLACVANMLTIPMFKFGTMRHPYMQHVFTVEAGRADGSMTKQTLKRPISSVVKDTMPQAFNAWINFTITFTVFPWLIFQMTPGSLGANFGSLMTWSYQIFDTVGRLAPYLKVKLGPVIIRYVIFARILILPFFFLCVHMTTSPFTNDYFRLFVMAVLALSNGVVITWVMIHGPTQVDMEDQEEQEVAGYTMAFALINGIFVGSLIAMIIQNVGPYTM